MTNATISIDGRIIGRCKVGVPYVNKNGKFRVNLADIQIFDRESLRKLMKSRNILKISTQISGTELIYTGYVKLKTLIFEDSDDSHATSAILTFAGSHDEVPVDPIFICDDTPTGTGTLSASDLAKETARANRNYIEYERAKDALARTLWSPDVCSIVQRFLAGAPRNDDFVRLVSIIRPEVPLSPTKQYARQTLTTCTTLRDIRENPTLPVSTASESPVRIEDIRPSLGVLNWHLRRIGRTIVITEDNGAICGVSIDCYPKGTQHSSWTTTCDKCSRPYDPARAKIPTCPYCGHPETGLDLQGGKPSETSSEGSSST